MGKARKKGGYGFITDGAFCFGFSADVFYDIFYEIGGV